MRVNLDLFVNFGRNGVLCMWISIDITFDRSDTNSSQMWTSSLVEARFQLHAHCVTGE